MPVTHSPKLSIVDFRPGLRDAFKSLNEAWIRRYFILEETDRIALEHPEEKIIQPGGCILFLLEGNDVLGCSALVKKDNTCFELAKMAVADHAQRRGYGELLGHACMERAKELGAERLYLESNTSLAPAMALYKKLGFKRLPQSETPYMRCNIQMELWL
ncbi:MAG: GNAT family N-acetyltransferase [Myxococcales bacterium]|nr:MAG: GNAT family N-acetyltransferase [Myxococcales bacterium]